MIDVRALVSGTGEWDRAIMGFLSTMLALFDGISLGVMLSRVTIWQELLDVQVLLTGCCKCLFGMVRFWWLVAESNFMKFNAHLKWLGQLHSPQTECDVKRSFCGIYYIFTKSLWRTPCTHNWFTHVMKDTWKQFPMHESCLFLLQAACWAADSQSVATWQVIDIKVLRDSELVEKQWSDVFVWRLCQFFLLSLHER